MLPRSPIRVYHEDRQPEQHRIALRLQLRWCPSSVVYREPCRRHAQCYGCGGGCQRPDHVARAVVRRSSIVISRGSSPTPAMLTRTARAGTSGSSRSAHSITVTPPPSISSSRPRSSSSVRVVVRYASTWCTGRRPRYSLTSTKVGLVAPLVTPSARTSPCTKTVLPAPSSPVSATTSPGPSVAPRRSPAASVASGEVVVSLARIREPTERLGERLDEVARDQ